MDKQQTKECSTCEGSGWEGNEFDGWWVCNDCKGTGEIAVGEESHG